MEETRRVVLTLIVFLLRCFAKKKITQTWRQLRRLSFAKQACKLWYIWNIFQDAGNQDARSVWMTNSPPSSWIDPQKHGNKSQWLSCPRTCRQLYFLGNTGRWLKLSVRCFKIYFYTTQKGDWSSAANLSALHLIHVRSKSKKVSILVVKVTQTNNLRKIQ